MILSMTTVRDILTKIKISGSISYDEPMKNHTTFKIGGNAEAFVRPKSIRELKIVLDELALYSIEPFILGGGANLLVSDEGIKGVVIDTKDLCGIEIAEGLLCAEAGVSMEALCEAAEERSLSGLEFIYGMPGSVGGSVFMNARCYDREMADVIAWVEYIDAKGHYERQSMIRSEWDYKKSPFQKCEKEGERLPVLLRAAFNLVPGDKEAIKKSMNEKKKDREDKGHFRYPCAGSVFKNSRVIGEPTGKILDRLGFRGKTIGDAMVSDFHANIFVNAGNAKAIEVKTLIDNAITETQKATGFILEPEVIFVGNFSSPKTKE